MKSSLAPVKVAGIEPRIPTVFGLAAVSQTFTVAHAVRAEAAAGAAHSSASAHTMLRRNDMATKIAPPVMNARVVRSTGMGTATMALPVRSESASSFEALYRSCGADVYAYVASLLRDRAAAEDVTALAFERALRKRRSFDRARGNERAWLFGIARNAALDELRRRSRTAALVTDPPDDALPDPAGEDAERRATVRAALASLDPRDRELIALKFHAGLSNAEIAKVIGASESTAGTRLHRAVTKLREACHAR
jgi:RNA polymerase sigma-70 factor (ECF subfamily)